MQLREWIDTGRARELRVNAGLSLDDLARDCQVTASCVMRWERGQRQPRGRNRGAYHRCLKRLADRRVTA